MSFDSSSNSVPPPDWHDLLAGYALGNLSPEEQSALQELLAQRPELEAELLAYQEALGMLPYALEPQSLPPGLEDRVIAAATQHPRQTEARRPASSHRPRRTMGSPWYGAAAAAAVLIAVVGVDNYRLRQRQMTLQTEINSRQAEIQTLKEQLLAEATTKPELENVVEILRQPNALVYSLQGTGDAVTSSGSLLTLPNHSEVQLVSHNLPVLPQDKVYRLWSVASETSSPIFCGEFNNTEAGNVQLTVPDTICNATPVKVIITVDAVVDPPIPKGPAVLEGSV
ncbi:anti-sigma factor domain-containing protein [Leptothoe sp. PORK10 BA2]|uniref:anti-sigma factor domain-containing protein n=1 Tax=Leptothoe sp. PORK10 BA2 TaxID=3110254 RepID=UPI002B20BF56|nr:anti-sigma factor [Leptothoe sp. PORK10 BA2]MEA5466168.1 anti-sigma factor [Leptothoe sp. PORK10 BA2]